MYDAPVNPMKDQLKNVYRRDQRYWGRRPLTRDMMLYAASDVLVLVPQVYTAMTRSVGMKQYWYEMGKPAVISVA
jgi:exonuclease 3'-5' domain-containing protein 1